MTDTVTAEAATAAALPSLRRAMLWRMILPLGLTWLLGSTFAAAVAHFYTQKAFDRSLLDDAYAIASNVALQQGELVFTLSLPEVGVVLFDHEEKAFFAVLRDDGSLLAGHGGLREGLPKHTEPFAFDERHYRGVDVRRVTLWRALPVPHVVVVAETIRSRSELVSQLLVASVAPQALLLLVLGLWLRRSIGEQLLPLTRLEQALEQRDTHDLTPVNLTARSSDIAHLAAAFNALMARIGAGVRAQREFAGNVAHELRTPLAGIRSLAEYGLAQKDPQAWHTQLGRIVASEERASHLVDQLLALAMADEARQSLVLEPVDVDDVVRDLLLRLLPRADAAGVDLGAEGLEQPLRAMATRPLLEGLLVNLTDNALRYGRPVEPGVTPRVTVEAQVQGDELLLSVTDNGPGMNPEQRTRVLTRWEQGPAGVQGGSGVGLGLAIVARYVALMEGRLQLNDAPDGPGLRASVWLRRAPAG